MRVLLKYSIGVILHFLYCVEYIYIGLLQITVMLSAKVTMINEIKNNKHLIMYLCITIVNINVLRVFNPSLIFIITI